MTPISAQTPGAATAAATAFVAAHRAAATALGERLGALLDDPGAFGIELDAGLAALADPVFAEAMVWVAPGVAGVVGVRQPLISA
ncbi:MAG: hypothetical protein MUE82_07715, partial [Chloroflexi bacterium]|nr:hypothetical protein [Chloroflexota bacterium]